MKINEARKLAGWTQARLSQELGIPRRTIEDWERGISSTSDWCERLIVREILRNVKVNGMNKWDENDRIVYVVYEDEYEVPYTDGMTKAQLDAAFWSRVDTCEREVARYDTQTETLLAVNELESKAFASVERFTNGRHVRGRAFFVREEEVDEDGDFVTGGDVLHTVYGEF